MKFYKEINLPIIPKELLNLDLNDPIVIKDIGYGLIHQKNNKILTACEYIHGHLSYRPLIDWLLKNVPGINQDQIKGQIQSSGTHIVHSDIRRFAALNYIVDTGGENVITSWYQEKNKPLKRNKTISKQQSDEGFVDYNNLEILDSVKFEKNKWYLIDVSVLHDVDNIETFRKSITISIRKKDDLDKMRLI